MALCLLARDAIHARLTLRSSSPAHLMSDQRLDPPTRSDTLTDSEIAALRAQFESEAGISPAVPNPARRPSEPASQASPRSRPSEGESGTDHSPSREAESSPAPKVVSGSLPDVDDAALESIEDVPDEQKAKILRKHLPSPEPTSVQDGDGDGSSGPHDETPEDENGSYHRLTGGDVVHDLYKWEERARNGQLKRSASFDAATADHASDVSHDPVLDIRNIREPGGFRRNFLQRRAAEEGREQGRFTKSFVDFLSLYGGFAGEDLEDLEGVEEGEEEEDLEARPPTEREPLLKRPRHRRKPSGAPAQKGDASVTQAVLMVRHYPFVSEQ
jgi:proton-coupled amino acid transporter